MIPFTATFLEEKAIPAPELDARLADPRELSGVLNRALDLLPRLRAHGLTESESMRQAWHEFRKGTDPLSVWLDTCTVDLPSAIVSKRSLLAAYNAAARRYGWPEQTPQGFGRALRLLRPGVGEAQRTIAGQVTWCFTGIGLLSDRQGGVEAGRSVDAWASRVSLVSRVSLYLVPPTIHEAASEASDDAAEDAEKEERGGEQDRENPVNPVKSVTICSECGGVLSEAGACWRHGDHRCRVCGAWTGSALRPVCHSCGLKGVS